VIALPDPDQVLPSFVRRFCCSVFSKTNIMIARYSNYCSVRLQWFQWVNSLRPHGAVMVSLFFSISQITQIDS